VIEPEEGDGGDDPVTLTDGPAPCRGEHVDAYLTRHDEPGQSPYVTIEWPQGRGNTLWAPEVTEMVIDNWNTLHAARAAVKGWRPGAWIDVQALATILGEPLETTTDEGDV